MEMMHYILFKIIKFSSNDNNILDLREKAKILLLKTRNINKKNN